VADVAPAFAKASQMINSAAGEYIEAAQQTGREPYTTATLTFRVASQRVGELVVKIGALGTVTQHTSTGTDVTNQVVDLEARLRNEQRIETELLDLLTSRKDAPLKEVLEVRDSLSRVRENIEKMTASQQNLDRMVNMATIVVSFKQASTPPAPQRTLWESFVRDIGSAWESGLRALVASVSFIIAAAVGGLVFWLLLGLAIAITIIYRRRIARNRAHEAPPLFQ
jgi:hypothetical protein